MSRISICHACRNRQLGVKTRISIPHTCGKSEQELMEFKPRSLSPNWYIVVYVGPVPHYFVRCIGDQKLITINIHEATPFMTKQLAEHYAKARDFRGEWHVEEHEIFDILEKK